jgi:hypothetical protein
MKQFIIKILLFTLLFFIIDRSYIVFRYNETNIFADIASEKMLTIKSSFHSKKNFDVLIFGSSHAQFGVSPTIIHQYSGLKCLNIAYGDGANIGKQLNLLKHLVNSKNSKIPKTIFFGMDVFTLNNTPVYNDQFQDILFGKEHYNNFKHLKSYITLYSRFIPRYLKDFKNNKYSLPYFRGDDSYDLSMFNQFQKYDITEFGWVKGYGILNPTYIRYAEISFSPNKKALIDLEDFISVCKTNNIELIFFQTPENEVCLKYNQKYDDFNEFMNELSHHSSVRYIDYNTLGKFPVNNDSLFFDSDHLNISGAKLFTNSLVKDILNNARTHNNVYTK